MGQNAKTKRLYTNGGVRSAWCTVLMARVVFFTAPIAFLTENVDEKMPSSIVGEQHERKRKVKAEPWNAEKIIDLSH